MLPCVRCDGSHNSIAVDLAEQSAATAPFRWHQPSLPPHKIVDSADCSRVPARHFGGKYAQNAKVANQTKTKITLQVLQPFTEIPFLDIRGAFIDKINSL